MSCYHPMLGYRDNFTLTASGKQKVRVDKRYDATTIEQFKQDNPHLDVFPLPCGNCIGCRLDYARQWAIRCMLESKQHTHNFFVTLTYSDDYVPITYHNEIEYDNETGEVFNIESVSSLSLHSDDLTKFMKDLRAYYQYHYNHDNIRFFGCGEYGDKTQRPHYHLILFNLPIEDLTYHKTSSSGYNLYTSDVLSKIWNKGIVIIGDVSYQSCGYVARYVVKKQKGLNAHFYSDMNIEAPFVRMSRRPGIAHDDYVLNGNKYYRYDELFITDSKGEVLKLKPPRYFDKLFSEDFPSEFESIKNKRKASAEAFKPNTDLLPQAYLSVKEGNKLSVIKSLIREI